MGNNNGKGQEKKVNKFGFNGKTTAIEISQKFDDQQWKERVVLITGTTAGIGYETARAFALMKFPPTLIFANRNIQLSRDIAAKFIQLNEGLEIHHVKLDLSSVESINECIKEITEINLPINRVILNAGIFTTNYQKSVDDIELTFMVNHLGHFHFTNLLMERLIEGAHKLNENSRVIVVASHSHYRSLFPEQFPLKPNPREMDMIFGNRAYEFSKLCNVLFANELTKRSIENNIPIRANSLHPASLVNTSILGKEGWGKGFLSGLAMVVTRSVEQAAATSLYCTMSDELDDVGGKYYDQCNEQNMSNAAMNADNATRLWDTSEQLLQQISSRIADHKEPITMEEAKN